MPRVLRSPLVLLALLLTTACARRAGTASTEAPRPRTDLITRADIERTTFTNAYDLVSALRPRWLQSRGPDTLLGQPGEVQVHLNEVRLGGVQTLHDVSTIDIAYIQFFDANDATWRWGIDHGHGAIYISTTPPR